MPEGKNKDNYNIESSIFACFKTRKSSQLCSQDKHLRAVKKMKVQTKIYHVFERPARIFKI